MLYFYLSGQRLIMTTISANLQAVRKRIEEAALKFGRNPAEISLLAVSKTRPVADIIEAANQGQRAFGENYAQEGIEKLTALAPLGLAWHFIGPLQRNKTRRIAESFDWVHSVERLAVAERLSAQRPPGLAPLQVCLQINISGEDTKSGTTPQAALALAREVARLPRLSLRGLMGIPAPLDDFSRQRLVFRQLKACFDEINDVGLPLDTLSMGMTHDLEAAIAEGSTLVRVGTAIFGERHSA